MEAVADTLITGVVLVREDKTVHMVLDVVDAELRIAVGPQSDARPEEIFNDAHAAVVRDALEKEGARSGDREILYNPAEGLDPDTVLLVEDHGKLLLTFSPDLNPHPLGAFAPPVAEALRPVLPAA